MPRIALEGATTDGRTISRGWIEQMAANYDPQKYGARIWLEHVRGMLPDGPFAALGDVLKLSTKNNDDGKAELHAELKPLDNLVAMNKAGQKIYSSIEVDPDFAGSGSAYLVGLGVTDSPASLGTEALKFSTQKASDSKLYTVKLNDRDVFSEAIELSLEGEPADEPKGPSLSEKIRAIFKRQDKKANDADAALRDDVETTLVEFAERHGQLTEKVDSLPSGDDFKAMKKKIDEVYAALDNMPDQPDRKPATGHGGTVQTDC